MGENESKYTQPLEIGFYMWAGVQTKEEKWARLDSNQRPRGCELCRRTNINSHHHWWKSLTLRLMRSKKRSKWARLDSNCQDEPGSSTLRKWSQNTGLVRILAALKRGPSLLCHSLKLSGSFMSLPQPKPFNQRCFRKEPWGLICSVIVNQPFEANLMNLVDILRSSKQTSVAI